MCRLVQSCAAECRAEESRAQLLRRWLELELATAGNVTCVVGSPSDPWYQPCVDLVEQRAFGEGQKVGGDRVGLLCLVLCSLVCVCGHAHQRVGHQCCGGVPCGEQEHPTTI